MIGLFPMRMPRPKNGKYQYNNRAIYFVLILITLMTKYRTKPDAAELASSQV